MPSSRDSVGSQTQDGTNGHQIERSQVLAPIPLSSHFREKEILFVRADWDDEVPSG